QRDNAQRARVRSAPISAVGTLRDALGKFPARLHGIWGQEDVTAKGYLRTRQELLQQHDADATFLTIPRVGHWVQYEAAAVVNDAIASLMV
ncbi:MAG TPA: hypothetical protein VL133_10600, partial [Devosia sp.]|nr:hypothetical protein [Devosia sp.]